MPAAGSLLPASLRALGALASCRSLKGCPRGRAALGPAFLHSSSQLGAPFFAPSPAHPPLPLTPQHGFPGHPGTCRCWMRTQVVKFEGRIPQDPLRLAKVGLPARASGWGSSARPPGELPELTFPCARAGEGHRAAPGAGVYLRPSTSIARKLKGARGHRRGDKMSEPHLRGREGMRNWVRMEACASTPSRSTR